MNHTTETAAPNKAMVYHPVKDGRVHIVDDILPRGNLPIVNDANDCFVAYCDGAEVAMLTRQPDGEWQSQMTGDLPVIYPDLATAKLETARKAQ